MATNNSINLTDSDSGIVVNDGSGGLAGRTITAGSGITVLNGDGISGNPVISSSGGGAEDFVTDSGTATQSGGTLNVSGGTGIDTSGATDTVTVAIADAVVNSVASDSGSATPTSNAFTIAGGTGVTTSATGATVTINASVGNNSINIQIDPQKFFTTESNLAPLGQVDITNVKTLVRSFDDTTEEYVNYTFTCPSNIDSTGTVTFRAGVIAATAAASKNIELRFGHAAVANDEDIDSASYTNEDSGDIALSATQNDLNVASWTETVSNLGWVAGDTIFMRVSRIEPSANDLSGDLYLSNFNINIPINVALAPDLLKYSPLDFSVTESNFAPPEAVTMTNVATMTRAFDDSTEEYVNQTFTVPSDIDTSGTVTFRAGVIAATAAGSTFIQLRFGHAAVADDEDIDSASYTNEDSGDIALNATQNDLIIAEWTETIANLGWVAGDVVFFRVSRIAPSGTNLTGDLYMTEFSINIPRI
ncbi:MAG: hypothetical protein R3230_01345 [Nitrosopumilaceae archaeon]|nr:hypothetical protein [Nitrosopumilaceae archaeon]